MVLARQLAAAGCPDRPYKARDEDGRLRFFGPSLHRLTRLTVREAGSVGPCIVPFVQDARFSDGVPPEDGAEAPEGTRTHPPGRRPLYARL